MPLGSGHCYQADHPRPLRNLGDVTECRQDTRAYSHAVDGPFTVSAGPTAAMAMLLGGAEVAATDEGRRLVASLDLSSGVVFAAIANRESSDAALRVRLRKACIRRWLETLRDQQMEAVQTLIIPGAGLGPLALDWCSMNPTARAVELDYEHVEAKRDLIRRSASESVAARIRCLECDTRDIEATRAALLVAGWHPSRPSVWVIEGLSYYISHEELCALVRLALRGSPLTRIILEFSCPRALLTPHARARTEAFHDKIATLLGGTRLAETDIDAVVKDTDAHLERIVHPGEIETELGWERHFSGPDDSAMRVALLAPGAA
ncbi:MAG: hypothetical protein EXS03_06150 [Phycisphaerales bacterium]|nr:hypothetical protein [Phycisphaerales bacterium]